MGCGPIERPWVNNERLALASCVGDVRVSVKDEVPLTGIDGIVKSSAVVAMQKGDLPACERKPSEASMAVLAG